MGEQPLSTMHFAGLGIDLAGPRASLFGTDADPTDYKYYEKSVLALGTTFSPNDVCTPKYACLSFDERKLDAGPPYTGVTAYYVRSWEQLNFSMGIDVKASASYLAAKADTHYNFQMSGAFSSNSIVVTINARTDFGRWGLKAGTTLDQRGVALLPTPKKFAETCGTRYVAIEYRASAVSAVIVVDNVSQEVKTSLDADFSAQGGWGPLSGSAASKVNLELKYASKQDRASVQVGATGGPGFGGLKGAAEALLGGDQQLTKIGAALATYLGGFTEANAASTAFKVRSLADFGYDETAVDPWLDIHERYLRLLAYEYRSTTESLDIDTAISDGTSPLAKLLPNSILGAVKYEIPRLAQYQIDLANLHHEFKDAAGTKMPNGLPQSRFVSSALDGLELRPRMKFDALGLNNDQLRVVLNAPPIQRLDVARRFNPTVQQFGVTWGVTGFRIFSIQLYFVDETGKEWDISYETPEDGGTGFIWWCDGYRGTEDVLLAWAMSWEGVHSGTFGLKIKNAAQLLYRFGFMEASWEKKSVNFSIQTNMIF
jgi:hypothetical protein